MAENEIREAVAALSGNRANILYSPQQWRGFENVLISLAEEYLKIEGWPEERYYFKRDFKELSRYREAKNAETYFNEALRLCKLAAMKEKTGMKEKSKEA